MNDLPNRAGFNHRRRAAVPGDTKTPPGFLKQLDHTRLLLLNRGNVLHHRILPVNGYYRPAIRAAFYGNLPLGAIG
jgi:hypothetical protein